MQKGTITQIIGPVVDVSFTGEPPALQNALVIENDGVKTVLGFSQHLGGGDVRTISMSSRTDSRGIEVKDTGKPISVRLDERRLGRMFDVLGNPIDKLGDVSTKERSPIHRAPPAFTEQSTKPKFWKQELKSST